MTTCILPSGLRVTVNYTGDELVERLAALLGKSAAAAAGTVAHGPAHTTGPATAPASAEQKWGMVHPTIPLCGAVQPRSMGAHDTPAPYYDCTTDFCGASIELGGK